MKTLTLALVVLLMTLASIAAGDSTARPVHVALVFDDGPVPGQADTLLALFASEKIRATFSYVGEVAERNPALVRKVAAAGHEIANHSQAHKHPKDLDDAGLEREIVGAQVRLKAITGAAPRQYWPPYIEVDPRLAAIAAKAGLEVFAAGALVPTDDWRTEVDGTTIRRKATTGVVDGAIILFHEWRAESVSEMPAIIAELKRQGCVFLTMSELAAHRQAVASAPVAAPPGR